MLKLQNISIATISAIMFTLAFLSLPSLCLIVPFLSPPHLCYHFNSPSISTTSSIHQFSPSSLSFISSYLLFTLKSHYQLAQTLSLSLSLPMRAQNCLCLWCVCSETLVKSKLLSHNRKWRKVMHNINI
jgi:hypothetical protein